MAIEDQLKSLEEKMSGSPTYYGSQAAPSSSDVSLQKKYLKLKSAVERKESAALKKSWYGDQKEEPEVSKDKFSPLKEGFKALSAPLYGIVGVAESALGKGTEKNVFKNIVSNIDEGEGFGDLMRKYGVNSGVATVAGFGLDVMLDPVNWATFGTGALVPRVFKGATKAGLAGAKLGLETSIGGKVAGLLRPLEGTQSKVLGKVGEKVAEYSRGLVNKKQYYNELIGLTPENLVRSDTVLSSAYKKIKEGVGETGFGKKFGEIYNKYFNYDVKSFLEKKKVILAMEEAEKATGQGKTAVDLIKDMAQKMNVEGDLDSIISNIDNADSAIKNAIQNIAGEASDMATDFSKVARYDTTPEAYQAMKREVLADYIMKQAAEDIKRGGVADPQKYVGELVEKFRSSARETGVEWYDKAVAKGEKFFDENMAKFSKALYNGDPIKARQILDGYSNLISVFKMMKIGLNPASYSYSMFGNAAMANSYGIKIFNKGYLSSIKEGFDIVRGKLPKTGGSFSSLLTDQKTLNFLRKNPGLSKLIFETDLNKFIDEKSALTEMDNFLKKSTGEILTEARRKEVLDLAVKEFQPFKDMITKAAKGEATQTTGIASDVMVSKKLAQKIEEWGKRADQGDSVAKALHWFTTKPMESFGMIDKTWKVGNFLHLTQKGVDEDELRLLSRFVALDPKKDFYRDTATGLYKLFPDAASIISSDMFMNYAAMPSAINILRSLPLFGAPFAAFSFAMLNKAAKTFVYNPAFYNKIQFMLNEINGGRSPLERQALSKPYYQFYNKTGMVSLPFFRENPVYLNAAQFFPHLTMNIFEPAERRYAESFGGEVQRFIDSTPVMKDPVMQTVLDYIIYPNLIRDASPSGQMGNMIWPQDATALQKVGYTARSLAEIVTPSATGALGLITPESVAEYIPSYRWRTTAYAKEGKTGIGAESKESRVSRTLRSLLATYAGVNVYPVNIQYNQ